MQHHEDPDLHALLRELAEVGNKNAKTDAPLSFRDTVSTVYQVIGILAVILGAVFFLFSIRSDVSSNAGTIGRVAAQQADIAAKLDDLTKRVNKLEK